jgi:hypothetical protein
VKGLVAGGAVLVLGAFYAGWACKLADEESNKATPAGKMQPQGRTWLLPGTKVIAWNLPGAPTADVDFGATSGTAGRLVFIGAAVSAVLALGDALDPILDDNQQIVLAVSAIVTAVIVGGGPLALFGLQARYRPTSDEARVTPLGDETLVASVPGVVIGSAVTAVGMSTQIAALAWAAGEAGLDLGPGQWPFWALGVITTLYCVTVAGSITVAGRRPPLLDIAPAADTGEGDDVPAGTTSPARILAPRKRVNLRLP